MNWNCFFFSFFDLLFDSQSQSETAVSHSCIQSLLLKFSAQELIEVRQPTSASSTSTSSSSVVISVDHTKLWAMIGSGAGAQRSGVKRKAEDQAHHKRAPGFSPSLQSSASPPHTSFTSLTPASSTQLAGSSVSGSGAEKKGRSSKSQTSHLDMEIENLLNQQSTKEQQSKKVGSRMRRIDLSFCILHRPHYCILAEWLKSVISDNVMRLLFMPRWAERFWSCLTPAQLRSSPLWKSSGLVAGLRSRSSATTGPKRTAYAPGTPHSRAPSCTFGQWLSTLMI